MTGARAAGAGDREPGVLVSESGPDTILLTVRGVLFDNDGVLVDSHEQGVEAWRLLGDEFSLGDMDRVLAEMPGVRAADTLARFLPPDAVAGAAERLEDLEVERAETTAPLAGAIELLTNLPKGRWTIVTSASDRLARARWRAAGVPIPASPVVAEDVIEGKPAPEPFLAGAERLGVAPSSCVVFEDSPSGGRAGVAAGAAVVAVGDQPWPEEVQPIWRVRDLTQVSVVDAGAGAGADGGVLASGGRDPGAALTPGSVTLAIQR